MQYNSHSLWLFCCTEDPYSLLTGTHNNAEKIKIEKYKSHGGLHPLGGLHKCVMGVVIALRLSEKSAPPNALLYLTKILLTTVFSAFLQCIKAKLQTPKLKTEAMTDTVPMA